MSFFVHSLSSYNVHDAIRGRGRKNGRIARIERTTFERVREQCRTTTALDETGDFEREATAHCIVTITWLQQLRRSHGYRSTLMTEHRRTRYRVQQEWRTCSIHDRRQAPCYREQARSTAAPSVLPATMIVRGALHCARASWAIKEMNARRSIRNKGMLRCNGRPRLDDGGIIAAAAMMGGVGGRGERRCETAMCVFLGHAWHCHSHACVMNHF